MKSVMQLIREADRGQLLEDAEEALQEIVNGMEAHGGSGEMTFTFKIKKKGDAFLILGDIKHKAPRAPRVEALFFFDADAEELTRRDPRQPQIPSVVQAEELNRRRHAQE